MIESGIAIPCLDPHANLTEAHRTAALNAGYGISYISDEAKFAASEAARLAQIAQSKGVGMIPDVK